MRLEHLAVQRLRSPQDLPLKPAGLLAQSREAPRGELRAVEVALVEIDRLLVGGVAQHHGHAVVLGPAQLGELVEGLLHRAEAVPRRGLLLSEQLVDVLRSPARVERDAPAGIALAIDHLVHGHLSAHVRQPRLGLAEDGEPLGGDPGDLGNRLQSLLGRSVADLHIIVHGHRGALLSALHRFTDVLVASDHDQQLKSTSPASARAPPGQSARRH